MADGHNGIPSDEVRYQKRSSKLQDQLKELARPNWKRQERARLMGDAFSSLDEEKGLLLAGKRPRAGTVRGRGTDQPEIMTLHALFTRISTMIPNSVSAAELGRVSAALEASHPTSPYGDAKRLELFYNKIVEASDSDCKCNDAWLGRKHDHYKLHDRVRIFREKRPRQWLNGEVTKMESKTMLVECDPADNNGEGGKYWFRQDSDAIREPVDASKFDRSECTNTCPLFLLRAFFALRGPDVILNMLKTSPSSSPRGRSPLTVDSFMGPDAPYMRGSDHPDAKYAKECRKLVDEWSTLVIWRIDAIMKGDWCDNCKGDFTPPNDGGSAPWWDVDTTHLLTILIDLVTTVRPISKAMLSTFFNLVLGNKPTPVDEKLKEKKETSDMARIARIERAGMLPVLVFGLTRATVRASKDGLEYLNMLVIRVDENARIILSSVGWQTWFATLLTGGPGGPVFEKSDGGSSQDKARQSVLHSLVPAQDNFSEEDKAMQQILTLTVSIVVLLLYRHFASPPPVIYSDKEGPLGKRMSDLLLETMDMLEDHSGWTNDVVALIRVLLTSLVIRIGNSARQTFMGDGLHHSWNSLFDLCAVLEDFVYFNGVDQGTFQLARAANERHYKNLGVHIGPDSHCEDSSLVKKTLETLRNLKAHELPETSDIVPDQNDREKIKKLKKQMTRELEFFDDTIAYFVKLTDSKGKVEDSNMLKKLSIMLQKRKIRRRGKKVGLFSTLRRPSLEKRLAGQTAVVQNAEPNEVSIQLQQKVFDAGNVLKRGRRSFSSPADAAKFMKQKKTTRTSGTTPQSEQQSAEAQAHAAAIAAQSEEKGTIAIMNKIGRGETVISNTSATMGPGSKASKSKTLRTAKSPERDAATSKTTGGGGELGDGPRRAQTGWKKGIGARTAPSLQRPPSTAISAGIEGPVLAAFAYMESFKQMPSPHSRQNSTSSAASEGSPIVLDGSSNSNSASPLPTPPGTPSTTGSSTNATGSPGSLPPDQSLRRLRATTDVAKPVTRARPGSRADGAAPFAPGSGAQAAMITGANPVTRARASAADYNPPTPEGASSPSPTTDGSPAAGATTGAAPAKQRPPPPPPRAKAVAAIVDNTPPLPRAATTGSVASRAAQTISVPREKIRGGLPSFDEGDENVAAAPPTSATTDDIDSYTSTADDVMSGPMVLQQIPAFRGGAPANGSGSGNGANRPPPPPPRRNAGISLNVPGSGAAHTPGAEDEPWSDPPQSRQRSATAAASVSSQRPPPPPPRFTKPPLVSQSSDPTLTATKAKDDSDVTKKTTGAATTDDADDHRSVRFDTASNSSWDAPITRTRGHSASLLPASVAKGGSPHQSPSSTAPPQYRSFRRRTPSQDLGGDFADQVMASRPRGHTRAHTRQRSELPDVGEVDHEEGDEDGNGGGDDELEIHCATCDKLLDVLGFYEHDGNAYCDEDYLKLFAVCRGCGEPIEANAPYVSFNPNQTPMSPTSAPNTPSSVNGEQENFIFHKQCFCCFKCKSPFTRQSISGASPSTPGTAAAATGDDGGLFDGVLHHGQHVYCRRDYLELFGKRCGGCREAISGEMVMAMGQYWHPQHFTCAGTCGREIGGLQFFVLSPEDSKRIAERKAQAEAKAGAGGAAKTESKEVKATPVISESKPKAFCEPCYAALFVTQCAICQKDIVGSGIRGGNNRAYHHDCYACVTCTSHGIPPAGHSSESTSGNGGDDLLKTKEDVAEWLKQFSAKIELSPAETTELLAKFKRTDGPVFLKLKPSDLKDRVNDVEIAQLLTHHLDDFKKKASTAAGVIARHGPELRQPAITLSLGADKVLYCTKHHNAKFGGGFAPAPTATNCAICSKPVTGGLLVVGLGSLHPACGYCSVCRTMLTAGNGRSAGGRPYCSAHFTPVTPGSSTSGPRSPAPPAPKRGAPPPPKFSQAAAPTTTTTATPPAGGFSPTPPTTAHPSVAAAAAAATASTATAPVPTRGPPPPPKLTTQGSAPSLTGTGGASPNPPAPSKQPPPPAKFSHAGSSPSLTTGGASPTPSPVPQSGRPGIMFGTTAGATTTPAGASTSSATAPPLTRPTSTSVTGPGRSPPPPPGQAAAVLAAKAAAENGTAAPVRAPPPRPGAH